MKNSIVFKGLSDMMPAAKVNWNLIFRKMTRVDYITTYSRYL